MSEHSNIDKIFKEGLGERKFSNADAMWQQMEADLDKEGGKKRRPFVLLLASAILIATAFFAVQHFNHSTFVADTIKPAVDVQVIESTDKATGAVAMQPLENPPADKKPAFVPVDNSSANVIAPLVGRRVETISANYSDGSQVPVIEFNGTVQENKINSSKNTETFADNYLERVEANAELIAVPSSGYLSAGISPLTDKQSIKSSLKPIDKRKAPGASKISIEAVGGVDLIRLNRKAGYYVGLRMNKKLESGSSYSVGVNYASHIISDRYRVKTKPADQRSSDARINSISSVRVPVYLQRQMGTSRFSMMVGLVPTYITQAEVYNVPNSYIGDPDPYRKFGLNDINRFNVLFGAGLKYSPTNWIALELSGSYGLTGMVKDGYKNLSRVNDNFKSIQLGAAFRLK